ncbi:MAG: MBL fold metallo-hydrolase [Atribacterota bacterium]|jgi:L-ascorbate metabolism protein UlaG (beta-lactamase superfamily)|nr:MBL fold metallo-hydrolase [Atribacterota bacterium]MDD4895689.1 MBL fold metallo-hydrolase [Atribacterota bacterium]MDD5638155.1 MBL fold metallo-hydrolase [Atribacterota bacterium]
MLKIVLILLILSGLANTSRAQPSLEKDYFKTVEGELEITFIGHGTLILAFQDKVIHIDPWSNLADYHELPQADIILITHEHTDHLDLKAIELIRKEDTVIVLTEVCQEKVGSGLVMKNGDTQMVKDVKITAVPAYNIQHKRDNGQPFHPRGEGNGYILNFADLTLYIAGDTENIPEMADLKNIDIAFLPMNLPYTMTPEMVAEAAKVIKPKILYPYHLGNTDTNQLIEFLGDQKDIEIQIRKMS